MDQIGMVRIAVCGHRTLPDPDLLASGIHEALQRIRSAFPNATFQVLSCLAEGADRLLARQLMGALPADLVAVLPLPEEEYIQDFASPASVFEFQSLKKKARELVVLQQSITRPQAYQTANEHLLAAADVLVAIWDGQQSRGPGGTAEIVAMARRKGLPILWIHCGPGQESGTLRVENLNPEQPQADALSGAHQKKEVPSKPKLDASERPSLFRLWWQEIRWILLGLTWLSGLALGFAGLSLFSTQNQMDWSVGDVVYLTLQLITLESGSVSGSNNWMFEIARFLLPALTAFTILQGLLVLFTEQLNGLRLRRLRNHVIVCGQGPMVDLFTSGLAQQGYRTLLLASPDAPKRQLDDNKILVLNKEADDKTLLIQARIKQASHLVCLFEADHQNLQWAIKAHQLCMHREKGCLTCLVHLASPELYYLLKHSELAMDSDHFQLEIYNPFARTAQQLVSDTLDPDSLQSPHWLVIGMGHMGANLIRQAALAWSRSKRAERLMISVLDQTATSKVAELLAEQPKIKEYCRINPQDLDMSRRDHLTDCLNQLPVDRPLTHAFLCLNDQQLSLQICLSLLRYRPTLSIPVNIQSDHELTYIEVLRHVAEDVHYDGQITPFDPAELSCSPALIIDGIHELLAQGLYKTYISGVDSNEPMRTWDHLSPAEKDANRLQANQMNRLIRSFGYRINPLIDWDASDFQFDPNEIEGMAKHEHDRWCKVKQAEGWRYGAVRDNHKRIHPDLVAWEHLPDLEREKNRRYVRELPVHLATIGFQLDPDERQRGF
jgi:hypothetical protein